MVGLSHLRFAAGVCVLTAGLLMGVPGARSPLPIPVPAVPPRTAMTAPKLPASNLPPTRKSRRRTSPAARSPRTRRKTRAARTPRTRRKTRAARTPRTRSRAARNKDEERRGRHGHQGRRRKARPSVAAVPEQVAPVPNAAAPAPNAVAPAPHAVAPVANLVGPVSDVIASVQDMLTPDAGAVVPLTQLQSDLYSFLLCIAGMAPVANLVGPVSDVIALVQEMLTPVAGAVVPLTQLQSGLYSFLLGIAGMGPAAGLGGLAGAGLSPAADAWVASQWPLGVPVAAIPGGPLAGNAATGVATLDVIALGRASALSGMAPPAPMPRFRPMVPFRWVCGRFSGIRTAN